METKVREWYLAEPERFWVLRGRTFVEVQGQPIQLEGFGEMDTFLHYDSAYGWAVYSGVTGAINWDVNGPYGWPTEQEAINYAQRFSDSTYKDRTELLKDYDFHIRQHYGLSPRYSFYEDPPCDES